MKIIASMSKKLSTIIPDCFSRYNDDYNENCVGDTFQSLGTPTILFESGHYQNDYQRENTRKYMCFALISSLFSIAFDDFTKFNHEDYYLIPKNTSYLTDVFLRNVKVKQDGKYFTTNISIMYREFLNNISNQIEFEPYIDKKGDLENMFGHNDIDFSNVSKRFDLNMNPVNDLISRVD
jgi:hypothetical protein